MNITFWILMILMLLIAIGLLVFPLLKARQYSPLAYKDSNLKINDEKIAELDLDLKEGRIDQHYYKAAREELDRELLIDIPVESKETAAEHYVNAARQHPALALTISVFVPMLALLLYLDLGMHNASDESFIASQQQEQSEEQPSVEEMTLQLEAKIKKDGGSVQEWIMLGRSHKYLGDNEQAANAFGVALEQDENNAQLMLELAEVLALNNNRVFADDSRALVLKAFALEPDNANTLWFAGVAEFQYGNHHKAIEHLTRLLPMAGGEEDVMKSIVAIVAQSRQALIAAGEDMPELEQILGIEGLMANASTNANAEKPTPETEVASTSSGTAATRLQVSVEVSDQVRQKFDANDIVFVYAKAKQGPRMPLAAERMTLAALPATIVLDDSMAMVEGMNLSAFDELVISARVSKTGSAIAQSGDYIGQADVNDKKADAAITIVIDTVVP
ncbi:MAG: c-type cytochrome biogenesis protein CcmI [Proteobacteria bacterium]|nr:c-type cytochrome biogenesis protein CcmI [Pseudomonadota bacterium]